MCKRDGCYGDPSTIEEFMFARFLQLGQINMMSGATPVCPTCGRERIWRLGNTCDHEAVVICYCHGKLFAVMEVRSSWPPNAAKVETECCYGTYRPPLQVTREYLEACLVSGEAK